MTQTSEPLQPSEDLPQDELATWHYLVLLGVLRAAITMQIGRLGLIALSDDDYARVTIAQRFAGHAKLDPSGTSWLPFPFWTTGLVMKLFDPSLETARLAAAVQAILATWLLFVAGKLWGFSAKQAFWAAAAVNLLPVVAVLGGMTVPEVPTAGLAVFAIVAITRGGGSSPSPTTTTTTTTSTSTGLGLRVVNVTWWGVAAMFAATLSRYETWPVAVVVAFYAFRRSDYDARWKRFAAAALCLAGPLIWILHNQIAHGDALSFLHRVASYRAALAKGAQKSEETSYLTGLVGGCPAVVLATIVPILLWLRRDRKEARAYLKRFVPWAVAAGALVAFLLAGEQIGGVPTHHPERTLLIVWILCTFVVADLAGQRRVPVWLALPVAALLALDFRGQLSDTSFNRQQEELAGTHLHSLVAPGQRVFVATNDYGYFAVMASFARPFDTVFDTRDPRAKSDKTLLGDRWNSPARLKAENAQWLVAPSGPVFPLALRERSHVGSLVIYELDPTR
jgi:hypothetical protein